MHHSSVLFTATDPYRFELCSSEHMQQTFSVKFVLKDGKAPNKLNIAFLNTTVPQTLHPP